MPKKPKTWEEIRREELREVLSNLPQMSLCEKAYLKSFISRTRKQAVIEAVEKIGLKKKPRKKGYGGIYIWNDWNAAAKEIDKQKAKVSKEL